MKELTVYTDGACLPKNPGPGGWAAVVLVGSKVRSTHSGSFLCTTNNRMEMMGIIAVMESLAGEPHKIQLLSDSMYVVQAVNVWSENWEKAGWQHKAAKKKKRGTWETVKNADLWQRIAELRKPHRLYAGWVRGHSGVEYNEMCDRIANREALSGSRVVDEGYMFSVNPKAAFYAQVAESMSLFDMAIARDRS